MAMLAAAGQTEVVNSISSLWNNYVNLETFLEDEVKQREIDMQEEYQYWAKVKPQLVKDKDGKYLITGLKAKK